MINKLRCNTHIVPIKNSKKTAFPTADKNYNIIAIIRVPFYLEMKPSTVTAKGTLLTGVPFSYFYFVGIVIPRTIANTALKPLQKCLTRIPVVGKCDA